MDELEQRTRSIQAERVRPDTKPWTSQETTEELMRRLIGALHKAFCTPPDNEKDQ